MNIILRSFRTSMGNYWINNGQSWEHSFESIGITLGKHWVRADIWRALFGEQPRVVVSGAWRMRRSLFGPMGWRKYHILKPSPS